MLSMAIGEGSQSSTTQANKIGEPSRQSRGSTTRKEVAKTSVPKVNITNPKIRTEIIHNITIRWQLTVLKMVAKKSGKVLLRLAIHAEAIPSMTAQREAQIMVVFSCLEEQI